MKDSPFLFLVCTGLGKIQRGFESYIEDLAFSLSKEERLTFEFRVFGSGALNNTSFSCTIIPCIYRNSWLFRVLNVSPQTAFRYEQISYFLGLLPYVIIKKPKAIYLGEYTLYCYLFKFRKIFKLSFHLVLYTGGQVLPGLFDSRLDHVHHVTDVYYQLASAQGIPPKNQWIIPHFVNIKEYLDNDIIEMVKKKANGKKILLSVGAIDKSVKRMHLIPFLLGNQAERFFPVILGEITSESFSIRKQYENFFGADGFIMMKVPRQELMSYFAVADIFILCSTRESFGLVYVEAMFANLPIVTNDFYEARFVCQDHACYINMEVEEELEESFLHCLKFIEEKNFCIENGKDFVMLNYTWHALRKKYLNMFTAILNESIS